MTHLSEFEQKFSFDELLRNKYSRKRRVIRVPRGTRTYLIYDNSSVDPNTLFIRNEGILDTKEVIITERDWFCYSTDVYNLGTYSPYMFIPLVKRPSVNGRHIIGFACHYSCLSNSPLRYDGDDSTGSGA